MQQTKYCSGRFYFLSKAGVQNLITKKKDLEQEYLEDYAIGLNLGHFYKEHMLFIDTNKYFIDSLALGQTNDEQKLQR